MHMVRTCNRIPGDKDGRTKGGDRRGRDQNPTDCTVVQDARGSGAAERRTDTHRLPIAEDGERKRRV